MQIAKASELDAFFSLKPQESSAHIEVWTDKKSYELGESVRFFFVSDEDIYFTLLALGTSGELKVLFPNEDQRDNFISADQIYDIPHKEADFVFFVDEPPGLERIKGIATGSKLRFDPQSLPEMIARLKRAPWAEASAQIQIIEKTESEPAPGKPRTIKPKKPEKPIDITGTAGLKNKAPKKPQKPIDIIGVAGLDGKEEFSEPEHLVSPHTP